MTSIVLAGGKSSRLGRNKALQVIGAKSLIQWVVDHLATLSTEIIIATAHGEPIPCSSSTEIRIAADVYLGKGPLVGIYSGLMASSSPRAIVVGCDMPFLSVDLLNYMSQISSTFDVVVPRTRAKVEPLCAVYSKNCLASIHNLLGRDELRLSELLNMVKVRYIDEDEINRFDPEHLSFFNVNTQANLSKARILAVEKWGGEVVG
jgi:molybdopterin-guanine dinucleotide biosynthesis protein A